MAGKMSPKFVALCTLAIGAIYTTGYSITSTSTTALATTQQGLPNASTASGGSAVAAANGSAVGSSSSSQNSTTQGSGQGGNKSGTSSASPAHNGNSGSSGTTKTSSNTAQSSSHTIKSSSTSSSSSKPSTSSSSTSATSKSVAVKVNTQKYLDGTYNGSASNAIGGVSLAVSIKSGKIADVQITACDTHYPQSYIDPVLPDYVTANQTTQIPVVSGATMSTADFYYALVQALSQAQNPNYKG